MGRNRCRARIPERHVNREDLRMRIHCFRSVLLIAAAGIAVSAWSPVRAGDLSVDLGKAVDISMVGAVKRWDEDGKPRVPVDPKAKIAEPRVDARGVRQGSGKWIFRNLPPGRYDLVILGADHLRVEGFRYPPITEFDPFLPPAAGGPEEETREWIVKHIAGSKHYENKVVPLFLAGDEKQVRILVQLVRDQATSFDADFGAPVATVRARGLAVQQSIRRLGEGPPHRSARPYPRPGANSSAGPGSGSPGLVESKWARSPQPSRVSWPRNTILGTPEAGFRTEPACVDRYAHKGRGPGASLDDYPAYVRGADIVSFDVYPVAGLDHPDGAELLWYVAKALDRLAKWTGRRQRIWNCIECTHINDSKAKATPHQVRAEVWMSLVHGSRGLIYFVHQFQPGFNEHALLDDPEMLAAVTAINGQIRELAPVLNGPDVPGVASVESGYRLTHSCAPRTAASFHL